MKIRIIKPWGRHNRIGEVLEVDREYAIPAIFDGYAEDITGVIKPLPPPVEDKVVEEPVKEKKIKKTLNKERE